MGDKHEGRLQERTASTAFQLVWQKSLGWLSRLLINREEVRRAPGAGKSTFLRRLGLEALLPRPIWSATLHPSIDATNKLEDEAFSQYDHDCLPVLIELRRLRNEQLDLSRLIQEELDICGVPGSAALVESLLKGGRLLLLLDRSSQMPPAGHSGSSWGSPSTSPWRSPRRSTPPTASDASPNATASWTRPSGWP